MCLSYRFICVLSVNINLHGIQKYRYTYVCSLWNAAAHDAEHRTEAGNDRITTQTHVLVQIMQKRPVQ